MACVEACRGALQVVILSLAAPSAFRAQFYVTVSGPLSVFCVESLAVLTLNLTCIYYSKAGFKKKNAVANTKKTSPHTKHMNLYTLLIIWQI